MPVADSEAAAPPGVCGPGRACSMYQLRPSNFTATQACMGAFWTAGIFRTCEPQRASDSDSEGHWHAEGIRSDCGQSCSCRRPGLLIRSATCFGGPGSEPAAARATEQRRCQRCPVAHAGPHGPRLHTPRRCEAAFRPHTVQTAGAPPIHLRHKTRRAGHTTPVPLAASESRAASLTPAAPQDASRTRTRSGHS